MKKNILLVVILVVIMASFVACNSTEAEEPVASEPASSEAISEEASSEEISEEVSEEVSEEASEEVVEIDLSKYSAEKGKNALDLVKAMNYNELKMIVWSDYKADAILSEGDSYVEKTELNAYILVFPKSVKDVKVTNGDIDMDLKRDECYTIVPYSAEDAYDVTCEVSYEDGTTETITVNITVFK